MTTAILAVFTTWCGALCWFDLRHRRLPDLLTGPGAAVVLGYASHTTRFTVAVTGAAILGAIYLAVHLVAPPALGAGDVKLAVGLGAVAALEGARAWVVAALAAPVLTAVAGAMLLAARRADRGVPHGPAMCLATLLAIVTVPP